MINFMSLAYVLLAYVFVAYYIYINLKKDYKEIYDENLTKLLKNIEYKSLFFYFILSPITFGMMYGDTIFNFLGITEEE